MWPLGNCIADAPSQDYEAAREKALAVGAKKFFLEVGPTPSDSTRRGEAETLLILRI